LRYILLSYDLINQHRDNHELDVLVSRKTETEIIRYKSEEDFDKSVVNIASTSREAQVIVLRRIELSKDVAQIKIPIEAEQASLSIKEINIVLSKTEDYSILSKFKRPEVVYLVFVEDKYNDKIFSHYIAILIILLVIVDNGSLDRLFGNLLINSPTSFGYFECFSEGINIAFKASTLSLKNFIDFRYSSDIDDSYLLDNLGAEFALVDDNVKGQIISYPNLSFLEKQNVDAKAIINNVVEELATQIEGIANNSLIQNKVKSYLSESKLKGKDYTANIKQRVKDDLVSGKVTAKPLLETCQGSLKKIKSEIEENDYHEIGGSKLRERISIALSPLIKNLCELGQHLRDWYKIRLQRFIQSILIGIMFGALIDLYINFTEYFLILGGLSGAFIGLISFLLIDNFKKRNFKIDLQEIYNSIRKEWKKSLVDERKLILSSIQKIAQRQYRHEVLILLQDFIEGLFTRLNAITNALTTFNEQDKIDDHLLVDKIRQIITATDNRGYSVGINKIVEKLEKQILKCWREHCFSHMWENNLNSQISSNIKAAWDKSIFDFRKELAIRIDVEPEVINLLYRVDRLKDVALGPILPEQHKCRWEQRIFIAPNKQGKSAIAYELKELHEHIFEDTFIMLMFFSLKIGK